MFLPGTQAHINPLSSRTANFAFPISTDSKWSSPGSNQGRILVPVTGGTRLGTNKSAPRKFQDSIAKLVEVWRVWNGGIRNPATGTVISEPLDPWIPRSPTPKIGSRPVGPLTPSPGSTTP